MPILKLKKDDQRREIQFELDYLTSLTVKQRFEMMFQKSREMILLLRKNENRKTAQVIKRT